FGLARSIDLAQGARDATLTVAGAGTPAYMAPEQAAGRAIGPAADQYAFAVAAWEALAGVRPPDGAAAIPRAIRGVLARARARDPEARWPDMDALLIALDRAARRPRRIAIALAAAAAVVAAAIAVVLARPTPPAPAAACVAPAVRLLRAVPPGQRHA